MTHAWSRRATRRVLNGSAVNLAPNWLLARGKGYYTRCRTGGDEDELGAARVINGNPLSRVTVPYSFAWLSPRSRGNIIITRHPPPHTPAVVCSRFCYVFLSFSFLSPSLLLSRACASYVPSLVSARPFIIYLHLRHIYI